MRLPHFGRDDLLRGERADDAVGQVVAIGRVIDMLELAAATAWEMSAGWCRMVRPRLNPAIGQKQIAGCCERSMAAISRSAFAPRGDSDDKRALGHRQEAI